jgi:hypothetical protein
VAHFEPVRTREAYLERDRNLLRFYLERKYKPESPMGNVAISDLRAVISAPLIGLYDELAPLIPRAVDWLDKAIARDECFGPNHDFCRYQLLHGKAMALWMRDRVNAVEEWQAARQALKSASQQPNVYGRAAIKTDYLDDYLVLCYQAGQYEEGIAEYEKYHALKGLSLQKTLAPRRLACALCLHEARQQFDPDKLFQAGRAMLKSYVQDAWLAGGHYTSAAKWLKIVYWHRDRLLTPPQTILKAYEYLPDVPRPDFV